jgi:hypothetical protein
LLLSTLCFSATTCRARVSLIPVGDARVVGRLPSGNFEVTPAFILWALDLKDKIRGLELKVKLLEERLDRVIK